MDRFHSLAFWIVTRSAIIRPYMEMLFIISSFTFHVDIWVFELPKWPQNKWYGLKLSNFIITIRSSTN